MMTNYMPVKTFFGENCLKKSGNEIAKFGKRALLVTGRTSAKKSGVLADLLPLLQEQNIAYTIFDEITENPQLETVHKGARLLRQKDYDLIIGIGGGSPIDAAKAISVIAANKLQGRDFYDSSKIKSAYPLIAIPTTSGTGTEVTPFSVITDAKLDKKAGFGHPLMFAKLAFLDPRYTLSLPTRITRDTAIDALSHLLEGIYSNKRNKINYPYIFKGIKLILQNLKPCLIDPTNLQYRENLMLASMYGGIVIAQTSTTIQHSIGYPLTTKFGLSHGLANGIAMQPVMKMFYPYLNKDIDQLFAYVQITRHEFFGWLEELGMKPQITVNDAFIQAKAQEVIKSRNMALNPLEIDLNGVIELYYNIKQNISLD
jgi:alcohol dehydrogenase